MKEVIKFNHSKYQTRISIPKGIRAQINLKAYKIGRVWINEQGNIEIEVLDINDHQDRYHSKLSDS